MITPQPEDTFTTLVELVEGIDRRFPKHNHPFARVSRLTEETGELAAEVNHAEGMGIKNDKHGPPDTAKMVKEIQDVLRATIGIAAHYGLLDHVRAEITHHHHRYQTMGYL